MKPHCQPLTSQPYKDIMNPEEEPETPKKPQKTIPEPVKSSQSKLKFRYTVIEKPRSSPLGIVLIMLWVSLVLMLLYSSYHSKLKIIENEASEEQIQCRMDFEKNKCEKGLKATISYCEEKRKCFEAETLTFYESKVDTSFIAGEIIKAFVEGAGLYVCLGGLFMIYLLIRKQPSKEIRKEYEEYFE